MVIRESANTAEHTLAKHAGHFIISTVPDINIYWSNKEGSDFSLGSVEGGYKPFRLAGMTLDDAFSFKARLDGFNAFFQASLSVECPLFINGHSYSSEFLQYLLSRALPSSPLVWKNEEGQILGWVNTETPESADQAPTLPFLGEELRYAWQGLTFHESLLPLVIRPNIPQGERNGAYVRGNLQLGENTEILPGVVIEGNVIIGDHCRIGPNCYIRGNVSIGNNCVVGQGVEVKNSIIGNRVFISHLSYVGDSILGDDVNIGGGTIFSNFRHDEQLHRCMNKDGILMNTDRLKLGAILEEGVKTGANSVILPGRRLAAGRHIMPGEIVRK